MPGRAFVDTNVLVYAFDEGEPAKQALARELLATMEPDGFAVSAQVLNEFYVATTRKLARPLASEAAEQAVRALARLDVAPVDASLVLRGVARARASDLSLWDALIVEAALRTNCERILTEDLTPGQRFDDVTVVNPFE